ncbi:glycine N-acyltransferase-like protein 3 [Pararge aegeria]|uniref:glycine N-acyltransferase-like protein 3 n=1 Tax=Pararge aegeria TaxID=116150 RepID=UPI0019CF95D2|nr:glycine N-acyltransferase-like protein 3 [Pararge aegeria]
MSDEPLVFTPVDRWSELKSVFKSDWPRSILGVLLLENQESLLKSGVDYGFKVYCPFGDVNNGMVALNIKDKYYDVIIQCPKDDTRELEEALKTTSIVDWKKCDQIPVLPKHVMDCVKRLYSEKNLKIEPIVHITRADTFVLDKEASPYDVRLPPGHTFEFLSLDSVPLVNETWPHKYPGSEWYYEFLIKAKLGFGLYNGKELIAWVFLREIGCLGHLYTLEKHRRKGYGELVLKLISNKLLKDKKYTVAYCAAYNTNGANLYKKLGFKNLLEMDWCNF